MRFRYLCSNLVLVREEGKIQVVDIFVVIVIVDKRKHFIGGANVIIVTYMCIKYVG